MTLDRQATPTAAFELRTPRLTLREFAGGDETDLMALHLAPRLREHLVDDHPLHEPASAALFIERIQRFYRLHPGLGIWHTSVRRAETSTFAGWFSLMPLAAQPGEVELGSRLLPELWGQGVAMDGGEALLNHAFTRLGLRRVWGLCDPRNRGARLCLAALGFAADTLAPYEGGLALRHRLEAARWPGVRSLPRRERLRHATNASRASAIALDAAVLENA